MSAAAVAMQFEAPLFTASGAERVARCAASASLPAVYETSEDAERGTSIHQFCKSVLLGIPREQAAVHVPKEWRGTCERLKIDKGLGGTVASSRRPEVSYSLSTVDGGARELGVDLGRAYQVYRGEVPGTLDVEAEMLFTGVPVVVDWKTGQQVTECKDNKQLAFAARARATLLGVPKVEARVVYIHEDGDVHTDSHVFTRFELDGFADDLSDAYDGAVRAREAMARGERPVVNAGPWCRYCPALMACPKYASLARELLGEVQAMANGLPVLSPEQRGEAWRKLKMVETVTDSIKDSLKEMARQQPFPTSATKEVRETTVRKTYFQKERALQLLRAKGATSEEIASCEDPREETQVRELAKRRA